MRYRIRNWSDRIITYWAEYPIGTQVWPLPCNASIMWLIFEQEN